MRHAQAAAVLVALSAVAHAAPKVSVQVNPRIELIAILFRLAGNPEYGQALPTPYAKAVEAHFAAFKGHPAVAASAALAAQRQIGFNAPVGLAVYLDAAFHLAHPLAPFPAALDDRWKDVNVEPYLKLVRDFAVQSRFGDFMKAHEGYHKAVEERMRAALTAPRILEFFDATFGPPSGTRTYVPGLLTGTNNYGAKVGADTFQIVMLERPDADGVPRPGDLTVDLATHETAHGYVNPIMDAHHDALAPAAEPVYAMVQKQLTEQAYTTAGIMVNESVVRAVTILCIGDRRDAAAAKRATDDEQRLGFFWMPELVAALDALRKAHGGALPPEELVVATRGVLEDFFRRHPDGPPRLPYIGPINAAFEKGMTIVTPPAGPARAYALVVAKKLGATPVDAGPTVPAGALMVYGSPATNPTTAALLKRFGWSVTDKAVVVGDRRFEGPHLVLIAGHAQPDDPMHGVVVYTAADDLDIVGVNSVFHGPTDWVAARHKPEGGFEIVDKGNLPRK